YFIDAHHEVEIPTGALEQSGHVSKYTLDPVKTYSFGARLCPTLPIGLRARAWASIGAGWGRLEFGRMTVHDAGGDYLVRERAGPFVEFPLGLGGSFDVIPRWLSVEVELTGAFVTSQTGENVDTAQAIDKSGKITHVGGFPLVDGTFAETVGLSLIL